MSNLGDVPPVIDPEPTVAYPREGQLSDAERNGLINTVKGGASWFFWIAGLTMVNSIIAATGSEWSFSVGLAITSVADAFAHESKSTGGMIGALVFGAVCALINVGLGVMASKRHRWAFVVGLLGLGVDTLLLFVGLPESILPIAIHLWAMWAIANGFRAAGTLNKTGY